LGFALTGLPKFLTGTSPGTMVSLWSTTENLQNFIAITSRLVGAPTKETILCGAKREYQPKCSGAKKAMQRLWVLKGKNVNQAFK